ncbi:MAG: glycosyl transferase family 39 [uncultured bacterium]|nr:MAG: glycosyl transferase family 39 [uncultured bacterium]
MKISVNKIFLVLIIALAAFLRLYNITGVPPQPTLDEVSIGYNAYSILNTGADEYGTRIPVLLRAYDDWRPALYVYLVIPFISIFGLDVLSVRLPSVLMSILTVGAVYFLVKELTKGAKAIRLKELNLDIPVIATFLFAISPWHIYLSRLGHEVNASFSFLIFGILFFFRFLDKKNWNIYLSSIFFALSFAAYQSSKIIIPILLLVLFLLYFRKLLRTKMHVVIAGFLGVLIIIPVIISSFDDNALIRFKGTSLMGNSPAYFEKVSERYFKDKTDGNLLGYVFDNRKAASILLLSNAHLSHFSPNWLFFNEGEDPFKTPTLGLLYLFELPLIFVSLLFLLRSGISIKSILFLASWALIAVLPGSVTTGYPHAMRAYALLPIPQILAAIGFLSILIFLKEKRLQFLFASSSLLVATISVLWFFHSYFYLLPRELSQQFQFGVINALNQIRTMEGDYKQIVVSNKDALFESYMFYLFSNKYDPGIYQDNGGTISGGYDVEHTIGKYTFGNIGDKISKNRLYIMNLSEFEDIKRYYALADGKKVPIIKLNVLSKINYLNGKTSLVIVETK